MMMAGIDHVVDCSQPGGLSTPMTCRNWLIGPYCGLNSMFHTTAIATIEVMYGKNAAVRKNATPRSLRLSRRARPSETTQRERDVQDARSRRCSSSAVRNVVVVDQPPEVGEAGPVRGAEDVPVR